MLWEVWHLWSAGSCFAFNTYRHWQKLVLREQEGLIMSKEGVTQCTPLSMILYALAEWFADNAALAGFYMAIDHWFARLCEIGPPRGYIPEPSKSILITHSKAGNHYLGGYLGKKKLAQAYAEEKATNWVLSVDTFSDMMGQQPQAAFAGFAHSLQCKWAYLQ
eukprot:15333888-Ditylum_brightwellii.AAC.1